jgi:hypothetical protein
MYDIDFFFLENPAYEPDTVYEVFFHVEFDAFDSGIGKRGILRGIRARAIYECYPVSHTGERPGDQPRMDFRPANLGIMDYLEHVHKEPIESSTIKKIFFSEF